MLQHIRWQYLVNGCEVGIIVRNYRETFPSDMCQKRMLKSDFDVISVNEREDSLFRLDYIYLYTHIRFVVLH